MIAKFTVLLFLMLKLKTLGKDGILRLGMGMSA